MESWGTKGLDELSIPEREGVLDGGEELGLPRKGDKTRKTKDPYMEGRLLWF